MLYGTKHWEEAILQLSTERDKTYIYITALKNAVRREIEDELNNPLVLKKDSKKFCENCKNRGRGVEGVGSDGHMHCAKYSELDERYCINNNDYRFWEA